jgi:hypothetical protein
MKELIPRQVNIDDLFWSPRLAVNSKKAIFHQWEQLEATRCIDNLRIAAGEKDGFREGWFFANLGKYVCSLENNNLWFHQYVSRSTSIEIGAPANIRI